MAARRKSLVVIVFSSVALLVETVFGQNFDVYQYAQPQGNLVPMPDVDKAQLAPLNPLDNSCWQATASNLLAGAGYGTGATPQLRGVSIYNQITGALGTALPGQCEKAVDWWLYTFGKNPSSPEFRPGISYTDVTDVSQNLTMADYDMLLNELKRNTGQHVGVSFAMPSQYSEGHCMTLVGSNYWTNPNMKPDGNASIWHDSDRDNADIVVNAEDDVYSNVSVGGLWQLGSYPTNQAKGYTTLCPGLNKPAAAMQNYDVAYYMQAIVGGSALDDPAFREAGLKSPVYADPMWLTNPNDTIAHIDNETQPDMKKEVYLLVDYKDRVPGRQENILLQVQEPSGLIVNLPATSITGSLDDGQLLFSWLLDFQPAWEDLIFPDAKYKTLAGDVLAWDVSTQCVPEPATWVLFLSGGIGWWLLRRR